MAKQIGVPNQNRRLFFRNKLILAVYSRESLVILWRLLIRYSNLKLTNFNEASFNRLYHENQVKVWISG